MNIRLLGTGGADGIPGFGGNNEVSRYARLNRGKDLRTRSAALVDGIVKIDLPPDTFCQMVRDGLDVRDWSALVFTHSHEDHFTPSEIQYIVYPFTELEQVPFSIFGNRAVSGLISLRYPEWPIHLVEMSSFNTYRHGEYTITPVKANHSREEECLNLVIQREKTLIYATDTGVWSDETFEFLKRFRADCLVIECTEGLRVSDYWGHLNVESLGRVLERLRVQGTLPTQTRVVTTHHAATGEARHCDLVDALAPIGAEPGFDGMFLEF